MDIGDEKRGNPIKAAFEILEGTKVYINSINAGSLINVIPRECDVIFSVKQEESLKVINIIKKRIEELKKRYINESFILNKIAKDINVMDYKSSQDIIAIGTNTFDVHSVNERIEIKSIEKTWKIILEILKKYRTERI